MIRLATTTSKLQAFLGGSVTTNPVDVYVSHSEGTQLSKLSGTTVVDICKPPKSDNVREVDYVAIYNADTVSATVTIRTSTEEGYSILYKKTLAAGETLEYVG